MGKPNDGSGQTSSTCAGKIINLQNTITMLLMVKHALHLEFIYGSMPKLWAAYDGYHKVFPKLDYRTELGFLPDF